MMLATNELYHYGKNAVSMAEFRLYRNAPMLELLSLFISKTLITNRVKFLDINSSSYRSNHVMKSKAISESTSFELDSSHSIFTYSWPMGSLLFPWVSTIPCPRALHIETTLRSLSIKLSFLSGILRSKYKLITQDWVEIALPQKLSSPLDTETNGQQKQSSDKLLPFRVTKPNSPPWWFLHGAVDKI